VTNIFLFDYPYRLQSWAKLRDTVRECSLEEKCQQIDKFWQQAPLVNHYLHTDFIHEWPDPWQLIADNTYCYYGRALGMIYTLYLSDTKNLELVLAKDDNSNEVVLVLVEDAKYTLNYWPDMVLNTNIKDFSIIKTFNITPLNNKIG
jgi:hypothetical protein